jgi:hypothetical protein
MQQLADLDDDRAELLQHAAHRFFRHRSRMLRLHCVAAGCFWHERRCRTCRQHLRRLGVCFGRGECTLYDTQCTTALVGAVMRMSQPFMFLKDGTMCNLPRCMARSFGAVLPWRCACAMGTTSQKEWNERAFFTAARCTASPSAHVFMRVYGSCASAT